MAAGGFARVKWRAIPQWRDGSQVRGRIGTRSGSVRKSKRIRLNPSKSNQKNYESGKRTIEDPQDWQGRMAQNQGAGGLLQRLETPRRTARLAQVFEGF